MTLELPDFNNFESTVAALFSRVRGHIEPGAHRIQKLISPNVLSQLQNIPSILIAGTNGKGTTCACLEQCLRDAGYRTALYTSPHIVSPVERIRIHGKPISNAVFLTKTEQIFQQAKSRLPDATFFELISAVAFEIFVDSAPDVLVCEVGLGGRLDSTNVLNPLVSAITSIGMDHTEWLGDSLDKIAYEKAFVSRRNRPLVIGAVDDTARKGVLRALQITGGRAHWVQQRDSMPDLLEPLVTEILNQLAQAGGPRVDARTIKDGQLRSFWPGRLDLREVQGTKILFDAAHNSHGIEYFLSRCQRSELISRLPTPWILVYATLEDKDWKESLSKLFPHFSQIYFTRTNSPRAVHPESLIQYTRTTAPAQRVCGREQSQDALDHALALVKQEKGSLFILGSITLLGEAMEHYSIPVFPDMERAEQ